MPHRGILHLYFFGLSALVGSLACEYSPHGFDDVCGIQDARPVFKNGGNKFVDDAGGSLLFITIIGLPFATQHFKMPDLSLAPFGKDVILKM